MTDVAPHSEFAGYLRGTFANLSRRWHEAVRVLQRLDPVAGDLRVRSAYYQHLSNAHHMLGEYSRGLAVARLARERFPDRLAARQLEVGALAAVGSSQELDLRLSEALALPTGSVGDAMADRGFSVGRLLLTAAREARAHGYPAIAKGTLSQLSEWITTRLAAGDTTDGTQRLRVDALRLNGEWDKARTVADSLVALHSDDPGFVGVLGVIMARQGQRAEAGRIAAQLAGIRRPDLFGEPTLWRARISAQLGDKDQAVALMRNALAEGSRALAGDDADPDLEPLRDYPPFRELARARD
jgi:tetratricopeptide (TPR) repeat protein